MIEKRDGWMQHKVLFLVAKVDRTWFFVRNTRCPFSNNIAYQQFRQPSRCYIIDGFGFWFNPRKNFSIESIFIYEDLPPISAYIHSQHLSIFSLVIK